VLIVEPRPLLQKLNATCKRAFEVAAGDCVAKRHYEVTVEHVLLALLQDRESDICTVLEHFQVDPVALESTVQRYVGELRTGNPGKPVFSALLLEWVQDAWVYVSAELELMQVRSGALLVRLSQAPSRYLPFPLPVLDGVPRDELRRDLALIGATSREAAETPREGPGGGGSPTGAAERGGPLERFTSDVTEAARTGRIDPIIGREAEVRQVIQILLRRRKNNPIVVGEAGVGKTALVEGLALRIVAGDVPEGLRNVRLLSLDLGALQAGAGVKGEFENRLKGVIEQVKASEIPIVLFIDEVHMLMGAGGQQAGDAANLLKPALARGELRTIGATTYAEFKRYIEKDPALERRFQPVHVHEPSVEVAITMLMGVAEKFATAHGVFIHERAIRTAVTLSDRYISGRQLPDKAVDLLDTAATYLKLVKGASPARLEDELAHREAARRELAAKKATHEAGVDIPKEEISELEAKIALHDTCIAELEVRLAKQRGLVDEVTRLRGEPASDQQRDKVRAALKQLADIAPEERLVAADVDEQTVAHVVSNWTGIPVGNMVKDEAASILGLEATLHTRVRGQDEALSLIARELRAARAGLKPESNPLGVFLAVGPSGVGKTETALALADALFGGERFIVTINMSEFQERHTVSRLIGSPPGYVGYGEGGVLTEAVRHRPYSVVLLDEVEKADAEVMNIFYQVFDKGTLADGEGRVVDFRNTVIMMTSNLATDLIAAAGEGPEKADIETLTKLVRPTLNSYFKPALLARMTVVPYLPISPDILLDICRMKLAAVQRRTLKNHKIELSIADSVFGAIVERCREVETGARNVDHILRGSVLPVLANRLLAGMSEGRPVTGLKLDLDKSGGIVCHAEEAP
jgi:type VI secretion system protein VasG